MWLLFPWFLMSDNLSFFTDYLAVSIRLAVPIAFAALGIPYNREGGR